VPPKIIKIPDKIAEYALDFELGPNQSRMKAHLGGKDEDTESKFSPEIKLSRWNDKANFKILVPNVQYKLLNEIFDGNEIVLNAGPISARFYYKDIVISSPDPASIPDRVDQGLEFEVQFNTKPAFSSFQFHIDFPEGLSFYKQTEPAGYIDIVGPKDEPGKRWVPDEVYGSYAVYWNEKNNDYRTGKFCHIYRPKLTDALNNEIWAEIDIDPVAKTLTISWDNAWMQSASLPVILDPTIGDTDASGGSTNTCYDDYIWAFELGAMSETGTVDSLHWYNGSASSSAGKLGCFEDDDANDSPDSLIDYTAEIANLGGGAGWKTDSGTQSGTLTSGRISYCGPWIESANLIYQYDQVSGYSAWYESKNYSTGAFSDPHGKDSEYQTDHRVSCYVTYSAGGESYTASGSITPAGGYTRKLTAKRTISGEI